MSSTIKYNEQSFEKVDKFLNEIGVSFLKSGVNSKDFSLTIKYDLNHNKKYLCIVFTTDEEYEAKDLENVIYLSKLYNSKDLLSTHTKLLVKDNLFNEKDLTTFEHNGKIYKGLIKSTFDNKVVIQLSDYTYKIFIYEEVKVINNE